MNDAETILLDSQEECLSIILKNSQYKKINLHKPVRIFDTLHITLKKSQDHHIIAIGLDTIGVYAQMRNLILNKPGLPPTFQKIMWTELDPFIKCVITKEAIKTITEMNPEFRSY